MGQAVSIAEGIFSRHKCPYAQLTAEQAIKNGINVRLVADVIIMESGCKPHIFSPAGATGLMQIMPAIHHISVKALLDPAINIKVGTQYLALLVHKFGEREGLHHYLGMGSDDGNMTGDEYASRVISMSARRRRK
jgi:soluble lytic murein transglycosylase-like protein